MVSDVDGVSLVSAKADIDCNGLSDRITLLPADPTGPIMPYVHIFLFLPLYSCRFAPALTITPGGEKAFVSRMVAESITFGQRCRHVPPSGINSYTFASRFSQMVHSIVGKQSLIISGGPRHTPPYSFNMPSSTSHPLGSF